MTSDSASTTLYPISFLSIENNKKMNRRVISLFSFGILLIVIGAVGSFFEWPQSMLFIGMGLTLESLALIIFAWNKIKNR